MTTQGKREFLYGKIMARIKMPVGQGFWPAFWMLGANINTVSWPTCGETDIMEHINTDSIIYGTLHWNNNGHVQSGEKMSSSPSDYHVYSIEWDKDAIKWFVDDIQYHIVNIQNNVNNTDAFSCAFFLFFFKFFAFGRRLPGQTIDDSKLPAQMLIDYVRCLSKK